MMMLIVLVALRGAQYLRRFGVAKYRVSEQEDLGEHVCCLRFVNALFIPKRTVLEELSNASYHLYYTSRL